MDERVDPLQTSRAKRVIARAYDLLNLPGMDPHRLLTRLELLYLQAFGDGVSKAATIRRPRKGRS